MEYLAGKDLDIAGKRAVLIAGPTASGKSALALDLAARVGGTIVNADSMQVYRQLDILSARPGAADLARAPHHLYGHVAAAERYSVARWRSDVAPVLAEIAAAGRVPILVGGTGLYFKALTEGIAAVPEIPAAIRADLAAKAERSGIPALHQVLSARDPDGAARLGPQDRTRVLRALEVIEATGRPLSDWQREQVEPPLIRADDAFRVWLDPDRALLYRRIDSRFDQMVALGALAEVEALRALCLDPALPAMKAIGVREFSAFLDGVVPLEEAVATAKTETRRYAKRQLTWFRNQMPDWHRLVPG